MQVDQAAVLDALKVVRDPDLNRDIVSLGFIKGLAVDGGRVAFTIELTTPACPLKDRIQSECEAALEKIACVPKENVQIEFGATVRPRGGILDKAAIPGVSHVIAVAASLRSHE